MTPVEPSEVRYIKLGPGGRWAERCLTRGEMHFGFQAVPHNLCLAQDWAAVQQLLQQDGRRPSVVKDDLREIHDFYTLGEDCLWVTFAKGHLWWAFADPEVTWLDDEGDSHGSRMRRTREGWHRTDIAGRPLLVDELSTVLTQVSAYRRTLCEVAATAYLIRRINAQSEPAVTRAHKAREEVVASAAEMIAGLHWADFETLVDLIFTRGGWQRVSRVGGSQKDVDLILLLPTTGERAFVQVKSKAGQAVLDDYTKRFRQSGAFERMFFVCHSPKGKLAAASDDNIHVWTGDHLAQAAVQVGLFDWLIEKSA